MVYPEQGRRGSPCPGTKGLPVENWQTIIKPTKSVAFLFHHLLTTENNISNKILLLWGKMGSTRSEEAKLTLEQLEFRGTDFPHSKKSTCNYIVRGYLELLKRRIWLPYRDFNVILYSVQINIYTQSHACRSPAFIFISNDPDLWRYKILNKDGEMESMSSMRKFCRFYFLSLFFFFLNLSFFSSVCYIARHGNKLSVQGWMNEAEVLYI